MTADHHSSSSGSVPDGTPNSLGPLPGPGADPDRLVVGDLVIDLRGREARLAGKVVPLTRIEFDLVAYLAAHPGWVVSPDQLMEEVWGYRSMGDTRAVAVHIGNVRRKLGDSSDEPRHIHTVRGAGYKLVNPQAAATTSRPMVTDAAEASPPHSAPRTGTPAVAVLGETPPEVRPDDLVGRDHEMSVLAHAWEQGRRGHGGIVLLAGDAGIGKTRLAEELAAGAESDGGMVAWGRCHDAEGLPAYWPWIQMLRHLIENSPDDELRHDLQAGVDELTAVIPELRQRVPGMSAGEPAGGQADRERFFRAVTDYLTWSSRRRPLLLILDDLHVADPSSLLLLQALAPEISSSPLLILATYRDTELGPDHPPGGDPHRLGAHSVPPPPHRGALGRRRGTDHEHEHGRRRVTETRPRRTRADRRQPALRGGVDPTSGCGRSPRRRGPRRGAGPSSASRSARCAGAPHRTALDRVP